jgi:hypothetical protein
MSSRKLLPRLIIDHQPVFEGPLVLWYSTRGQASSCQMSLIDFARTPDLSHRLCSLPEQCLMALSFVMLCRRASAV